MAEADVVEPQNGNGDAPKQESQDNNSQENLTKLEREIIRQIEYYFSENNLRRDKFLIKKIAETEEGWVELSTLLTFNRLKTISDDPAAICDAVEKSANGIVKISEDRLKLRRHPDNPLPEFNEARRKETQARTAYAKGFPLDSDLTTLIEFFNTNFADVEQVIMRKYFDAKNKEHKFKGSVFITFSKQSAAEEFVTKAEVKYNEKELLRYTQTKYNEVKKQEREEYDKKKKAKQVEKEDEAEKEKFELPKQAVVHFIGVTDDEITREDIKARVAEIEPTLDMAFIHFNKGEKEGDLRFNKENDGAKLIEKLKDFKMKVKDSELTFNLVEGEEEQKFLERAVQEMKERRSKFSQRNRGGGRGGKHNFGNRKRRNDDGGNYGKRAKAGGD